MNASITPDAEIRLVTDAATDDAINARGSGDLTIRMRNENIGLYGTYTLMKGNVRVNCLLGISGTPNTPRLTLNI